MDHLIEFDQPTIINGVLDISKKDKLIYIGHSQGSTQFLASTGIHKFHEKIHQFIGIGSVISMEALNDHQAIEIVSKIKACEILSALGFKTVLILPKWFRAMTGKLMYLTKFYFQLFYGIV